LLILVPQTSAARDKQHGQPKAKDLDIYCPVQTCLDKMPDLDYIFKDTKLFKVKTLKMYDLETLKAKSGFFKNAFSHHCLEFLYLDIFNAYPSPFSTAY
jgi:hypothetical protein